MSDNLTPLFRQYYNIKAQYPDVLLLFRLGDFYELFAEDAEKAAATLRITLTSREAARGERIPMCGVPFHAAERYIARLATKAPKIDGKLDDAAWASAPTTGAFVNTLTGADVPQKTEAKLLWDKKFLYVGIENADSDVWAKQLADGGRAVALLNRAAAPAKISVSWNDIGYPAHLPASVRDLWARRDLGKFSGSFATFSGCRLHFPV